MRGTERAMMGIVVSFVGRRLPINHVPRRKLTFYSPCQPALSWQNQTRRGIERQANEALPMMYTTHT